ncbi:hypothetical protein B0H10DRAFT_1781631, partial [Mycena sp. CBHHK59/15]
ARMKGSDAQPKDGSIHAAFARPDERPAVPSDRTLTPAELRAHIVRWVAENNRPLAIVEDREFKTILGAGRPVYYNIASGTLAGTDTSVPLKCNTRHKLILGQFPPHKADLQTFVTFIPSSKLRQRFVKEDAIIKLHRSSRAHPSAIPLRESKFAAWSAL